MDGWAEWGKGANRRPVVGLKGVDSVRFCPRCDTSTLWSNAGGGAVLSCVDCGLEAGSLLKPVEVDRLLAAFR